MTTRAEGGNLDRRNVNPTVDANPQADAAQARVEPAKDIATKLTQSPAALRFQEEQHIDEIFKRAVSQIESDLDAKITGVPGSAIAAFKFDILMKVLQLPVFKYKDRWLKDVDTLCKSGNSAGLLDLRSRYWVDKGDSGLINEAVIMSKLYIERMTSVNGTITGDLLLKMLQSTSQQAAIYVDLLRSGSGRNRRLVEAVKGALGGDADGRKNAAEIVTDRLEKEYPRGEAMEILWMIMAFLAPAERVAIAKNYIRHHPDLGTAFIDEGNRMGTFGPEDVQNITQKSLSPDERATLANNWQKQHDFINEAVFFAEDNYGSINAAHGMNLINGLKVVGAAAALVTIGGNFAVTTFAYTRNKGFLEAIGTLPAAVKATVSDHNVVIAGTALGLMHYWEKLKEEPVQPKSGVDYNMRQGHDALHLARNSMAFWPEWDSFFTANNFAGGKAFANYIDEVIKFSFGDEKAQSKLSAGNFYDFLQREAKTNKKNTEGINYAKLAKQMGEDLIKTEDSNIELLATAFVKLRMGGEEIKDTYPKAISHSDDFMFTAPTAPAAAPTAPPVKPPTPVAQPSPPKDKPNQKNA